MSIISTPDAQPASRNGIDYAARPQWSVGRVLSRAIVVLIGVVVGFFIAIFIGLATGWIDIGC